MPLRARVDGTRQRRFAGTSLEPRKLPENAATPTLMTPAYFAGGRVHAVLGSFVLWRLVLFAIAAILLLAAFRNYAQRLLSSGYSGCELMIC